jgi:hypothetical protein
VQLFHIWHFLVIHFETLNGVFSSECVAHSTRITLDYSIRIVRIVRFGAFLKFTMETLAFSTDSLQLFCHCWNYMD